MDCANDWAAWRRAMASRESLLAMVASAPIRALSVGWESGLSGIRASTAVATRLALRGMSTNVTSAAMKARPLTIATRARRRNAFFARADIQIAPTVQRFMP